MSPQRLKHQSCPNTSDGKHKMQTGPNGEKHCTECGYMTW